MLLLDVEPHLFIRLVKFAGLALRLQFADHLLEDFHRLETALALVTLDVDFHAAVRRNRNVKFALGHTLISFWKFKIKPTDYNVTKFHIFQYFRFCKTAINLVTGVITGLKNWQPSPFLPVSRIKARIRFSQ